jgi:phytoene dehydrogenase-like protein
VRALVYIAALAPAEGQTVADVFYMNEPHAAAPKLAPDKHGLIWLPAEAFPAAFAQNASPEEQAELEALHRPISPACITAPVITSRASLRRMPSPDLAGLHHRQRR